MLIFSVIPVAAYLSHSICADFSRTGVISLEQPKDIIHTCQTIVKEVWCEDVGNIHFP